MLYFFITGIPRLLLYFAVSMRHPDCVFLAWQKARMRTETSTQLRYSIKKLQVLTRKMRSIESEPMNLKPSQKNHETVMKPSFFRRLRRAGF